MQKQALKEWWKTKFATVLMHTGTGKTWVFFDCLIKSKYKQCLILAETTVREKNIQDDRQEYIKVFGIDPFKDVNVIFMCYQSAHKTSIQKIFPKEKVFVFADEVHEMCTDIRWNFVRNSNWDKHYFLGETATLDNVSQFQFGDITDTKWNWLNKFAPVCFEYHIDQAKEDNTTRQLEIITYLHTLDKINKNILTGNKTTKWTTTEYLQNDFLDQDFKKTLWLPRSPTKDFLVRNKAMNRMRFLHSLPSKIEACKKLLQILPGRTLVFAYDSKTLIDLGIPAIVSENKNNISDLTKFINGEIHQIGSNKMLLQGANLNKIDNIILLSYDGKSGKTKQKAGRARQDLPTGKIIIFKTIGTQEEKWYDSMIPPLLCFTQKTITNIDEINE